MEYSSQVHRIVSSLEQLHGKSKVRREAYESLLNVQALPSQRIVNRLVGHSLANGLDCFLIL